MTINREVPAIWSRVAVVIAKQDNIAIRVWYLMSGIMIYSCDFYGHSNTLYKSILLYNFIIYAMFINQGENIAYSEGIFMWKTLYNLTKLG